MTGERVAAVADFYRKGKLRNVVAERGSVVWASHLAFLCDEIAGLVSAGRTEKAMRWLGFVQGVWWAKGVYPVDALKGHNWSESPTPNPAAEKGLTRYMVQYTTRGSNDFVRTGAILLEATDEADAGQQAVAWAHARDPNRDGRMDPRVEVDSVTEADALEEG